MNLVIIRPLFDDATKITFWEAQEVIDYAKSKGWNVIDLAKEQAVRERVEEVLKSNPNAIVAHYDHGLEFAWIGNDEKPCVDLSNVHLLANRGCYTVNCLSAKKLGVEAWKRGATYIGYKNIFYFTIEEKDYFKEFVNSGILAIIDGASWEGAYKKMKEVANRLIDELVKLGRALAAACMRHDADVLVLYDKNHPPESDCPFRRFAIKIFGPEFGWKIPRNAVIAITGLATLEVANIAYFRSDESILTLVIAMILGLLIYDVKKKKAI